MNKRWIAAAVLFIAPLVAIWEGERERAYLDPVNIPTVCSGHTDGVKLGMVYTKEQCTQILLRDLQKYALIVDKHVTVELPLNTLAATTSLVFNIGEGNFKKSTVLRRFNAGDIRGGCDAFRMWVYAGGKKFNGLVKRRSQERDLCLSY